MHNATSADVAIVVLVVGLRLVVPLFIPRFPLPAILLALIIDAADQTIFQKNLSPQFWHQIEDGYQGYDKALDVYYLSLAYVATMRNWTNRTALVTAQFLWLYRLFGVTLFEVVRDTSDPSSYRWLLLVFPNTFEYFFIAYEAIRLRWDPRRLSPRLVVGIAAFIWIFIKLPQEWWIHVAQLDLTDEIDAHPWILYVIIGFVIAVVGIGWWAIKYRLPAGDWTFQVLAPPLPAGVETAAERTARQALWRLFDWNLVEKIFFIGLVCIDFAQILPSTTATPAQVAVAIAVVVTINAAVGLAFARRSWTVENFLLQFVLLAAFNLGLVWLARALSSRFDPNNAMFFVLLITLIGSLYDRYRPVREIHREVAQPVQ